MKTITLVTCNRPHYLEQLLGTLRQNNLSDYTLHIGAEPVNERVIETCRRVDFMPTVLTVNPTPAGVAWNPFHTIKRAFDAGSEFNVHLEDDLIVSPDALELANWFHQLSDPAPFCLDLFNYKSNPGDPELVEPSNHFVPLGWCMRVDTWRTLVEPNWMCNRKGWDFSMNDIISRNKRYILQPKWARANHIGREGGVHCAPHFHDHVFARLTISDGSRRSYRLPT